MSKTKKVRRSSSRTICSLCDKSYANARSLSTHKSLYHRKPNKLEKSMMEREFLEDEVAVKQEPEESKKAEPIIPMEEDVKQEDASESESTTTEEELSEIKFETKPETVDLVRPIKSRSKNCLGKFAYQLDPSFDLMDAYEVKNLFMKLKEDCATTARPFTGRYMLFIDAIIELPSLTEVCSLLNSRAVMLKNIFKKLEQRNTIWSCRIRSFRLNANC